MAKRQWLLIGMLLVLAGVYAAGFTKWFKSEPIYIHHTSRLTRPNLRARPGSPAADGDVAPVMFGFDEPLRLTELKVVPLDAWQKDQHVLPLWHLVSDSNSIPITDFVYGRGIRGMKPAVPGAHAQPLQLNVTYRLLVQAGSKKGWHDFHAVPGPSSGP